MISKLSCQTKLEQYPIVVGAHAYQQLPELLSTLHIQQIVVVSDAVIWMQHASKIKPYLSQFSVHEYLLLQGEVAKSFEEFQNLINSMLNNHFDRQSLVIAFGGGSVGDLSGFAAASFMRGIRWLQLPTTLLAQVDAAIGGKTGINHPAGKNLIGAFHQPSGVVCDLTVLSTLPKRDYIAGLAEIIKYGLILDSVFFEWLEQNITRLLARDLEALHRAVVKSCELKAKVVGQDEKDQGCRQWLNFGHTFGHALEAAFHFKKYLHGEAVAIGMVMALKLSEKLCNLDSNILPRVVELLRRTGLPIDCPELSSEHWLLRIATDKKKVGGKLNFVLLQDLGQATVRPCGVDDFLTVTMDAHVK